MKIFIISLATIVFFTNLHAQLTVRAIVGKSAIVYNAVWTKSENCVIYNPPFQGTCNYTFTDFFQRGVEHVFPPFFDSAHYTLIFAPTQIGEFRDTFEARWDCYSPPNNLCGCSPIIQDFIVLGVGYNDSTNSVSENNSKISFFVYPNPSLGFIELSCSLPSSSLLHLHIFDELGKDIMTVFDGMMNEPQRDFTFTLPPGMYYARMETAEGVVTKKVVVE